MQMHMKAEIGPARMLKILSKSRNASLVDFPQERKTKHSNIQLGLQNMAAVYKSLSKINGSTEASISGVKKNKQRVLILSSRGVTYRFVLQFAPTGPERCHQSFTDRMNIQDSADLWCKILQASSPPQRYLLPSAPQPQRRQTRHKNKTLPTKRARRPLQLQQCPLFRSPQRQRPLHMDEQSAERANRENAPPKSYVEP